MLPLLTQNASRPVISPMLEEGTYTLTGGCCLLTAQRYGAQIEAKCP